MRQFSGVLCEPLAVEDHVIQSMQAVSPTKWHLAHTSWFFETLVLSAARRDYEPFHPQFTYLFNSYYNSLGPQYARPSRGLLSRPTVEEVLRYREHVDRNMHELLDTDDVPGLGELGNVVVTGLHHEQQHQELMLTDIKHVFASNPLRPVYRERTAEEPTTAPSHVTWIAYPEGVRHVGHQGGDFAYDNETPRHRVFLEPFQLASRLVTNGEYLAFIEDGGYARPEFWLSEGWNAVQTQQWIAPLYWEKCGGQWHSMTLSGMREINRADPVCHVSFFEADAFARWATARLPTESEWETAAAACPKEGNLVESGRLHPVPSTQAARSKPQQMFGDVWEWTASPYTAYPGYRPAQGALSEYNGKFMCNQMVLRGGSCTTSITHIRGTYRNFFPPDARWQFTGIRLAKDA